MSGVGMVLGHTSFELLFVWVVGVGLLGIAIVYGVMKAGRLSRAERERIDRNAVAARRGDDPEQRMKDGARNHSTVGWVLGAVFVAAMMFVLIFYKGSDTSVAVDPNRSPSVTTGSSSPATKTP